MGPVIFLLLSLAGLGLVWRFAQRSAGGNASAAAWPSILQRKLPVRDVGLLTLGAAGAIAWTMLGGVGASPESGGRAAIAELAALTVRGEPSTPPTPAIDNPAGIASVDDMIDKLVERLKREPGNAEGWRMLGWSYAQTDRPGAAAEAYAKAVALAPERADFHAAYAEALVNSTGGLSAHAKGAIEKALSLDAGEPRALQLKQKYFASGG